MNPLIEVQGNKEMILSYNKDTEKLFLNIMEEGKEVEFYDDEPNQFFGKARARIGTHFENATELLKKFEEEFKKEHNQKIKEKEKEMMKMYLGNEIHPLTVCEEFIVKQPLHYDNSKIWWYWDFDEKKWKMIDETDLLNIITDGLNFGGLVNSKTRGEFMVSMQMLARKKIPEEAPVSWIQFKDKIIDIETGEEINPSPEYFLTNPCPWKLGDSEETPTMDKMMEEWVGEEHSKKMYEIIAYCLLRDYPIQRIFVLIGSGCNGKGSFLRMLRKFVGFHNITSTELSRLKERFEAAKLYKKLLCEMAETNIAALRYTSMIKRLTGGDAIPAEFKNKNPFDFINYAKLIVATNSLPMTLDCTKGFYRRWTIIPFENEFTDGKEITNGIPEEEYENLARKCIRILKELLERGSFYKEGSIEDRRRAYDRYSMPIKQFIDENYDKLPEGYTPKMEFNEKLERFLSEEGFRLLTGQEINKTLRTFGFDIKNKKMDGHAVKCIVGLSLKGNEGTENTEVTSKPIHPPTGSCQSRNTDNLGNFGILNSNVIEDEMKTDG